MSFRHMFSAPGCASFSLCMCRVADGWGRGGGGGGELKSHCIHSAVFEWCVYCHPGLMSLVCVGTSQSLGTWLSLCILLFPFWF